MVYTVVLAGSFVLSLTDLVLTHGSLDFANVLNFAAGSRFAIGQFSKNYII